MQIDRFSYRSRYAISCWRTDGPDVLAHFTPNTSFYGKDLALPEPLSHGACIGHVLGLSQVSTRSYSSRVLLQRWRFVVFVLCGVTPLVVSIHPQGALVWGLELALYTALAFWRPSWRDLVIGPGILLLHPVEALELHKLPWILSATAVLAGIHRGTQSVAFIPSQPTEVTRKRKCCGGLRWRRQFLQCTLPCRLLRRAAKIIGLDALVQSDTSQGAVQAVGIALIVRPRLVANCNGSPASDIERAVAILGIIFFAMGTLFSFRSPLSRKSMLLSLIYSYALLATLYGSIVVMPFLWWITGFSYIEDAISLSRQLGSGLAWGLPDQVLQYASYALVWDIISALVAGILVKWPRGLFGLRLGFAMIFICSIVFPIAMSSSTRCEIAQWILWTPWCIGGPPRFVCAK